MDRNQIRTNYQSKVASPPAVGHQRAASLQTSSNNNNPVTPKEIKNKVQNLQKAVAVKKEYSPSKMSNTMYNDSKAQAWFKPHKPTNSTLQ